VAQSQNPRRSAATPVVLLNRPGQICLKIRARSLEAYLRTSSKFDELAKSKKTGGFVKSAVGKARKF